MSSLTDAREEIGAWRSPPTARTVAPSARRARNRDPHPARRRRRSPAEVPATGHARFLAHRPSRRARRGQHPRHRQRVVNHRDAVGRRVERRTRGHRRRRWRDTPRISRPEQGGWRLPYRGRRGGTPFLGGPRDDPRNRVRQPGSRPPMSPLGRSRGAPSAQLPLPSRQLPATGPDRSTRALHRPLLLVHQPRRAALARSLRGQRLHQPIRSRPPPPAAGEAPSERLRERCRKPSSNLTRSKRHRLGRRPLIYAHREACSRAKLMVRKLATARAGGGGAYRRRSLCALTRV